MAYAARNFLGKNKEKVKENIEIYSHFKTICTMTKAKSPCTVKICYDSDDDYIIYVIKYKTKSGMISESYIVLQPEIARWIEIYEQEGFVKI